MSREEFTDTLRRALYGKIDDHELAEHVRYYENYIAQEMAKGRSERDVLEELGDPRLIARTILETSGNRTFYNEYTVVDEDGEAQGERIHVHQFQGWKATAIMAAIAVVILLVLILVFRIFIILLPFLIVIGLVIWLVNFFR